MCDKLRLNKHNKSAFRVVIMEMIILILLYKKKSLSMIKTNRKRSYLKVISCTLESVIFPYLVNKSSQCNEHNKIDLQPLSNTPKKEIKYKDKGRKHCSLYVIKYDVVVVVEKSYQITIFRNFFGSL